MENQPTTLDKAVKISIIAGSLVVALSIAYYLVIFLPQKEKTRIEQQKQEQEARAEQEKINTDNLNKCLDNEAQKISKTTNALAKLAREGKNMDLGTSLDEAEGDYLIRKADCFKKYPQ